MARTRSAKQTDVEQTLSATQALEEFSVLLKRISPDEQCLFRSYVKVTLDPSIAEAPKGSPRSTLVQSETKKTKVRKQPPPKKQRSQREIELMAALDAAKQDRAKASAEDRAGGGSGILPIDHPLQVAVVRSGNELAAYRASKSAEHT